MWLGVNCIKVPGKQLSMLQLWENKPKYDLNKIEDMMFSTNRMLGTPESSPKAEQVRAAAQVFSLPHHLTWHSSYAI